MNGAPSTQVAQRYAQALFAAVPPDDRQGLAAEFKQLLQVLEDPLVRTAFTHPRTLKAQKYELVKLMQLSEIMENFLLLTLDKSRGALLPQMERHFEALLLETQGIAVAEVISAVTAPPEVLARLKERLSSLVGKQILLKTKVDRSLVGGLIIKVDGKVMDGSVTSALKKAQRALTG